MKISYCITAKDEHCELDRLLRFLKENIRKEDEVIIQLDSGYTKEILAVCNLFTNYNHSDFIEEQSIKNSKYTFFDLANDFASFKNNLFKHATGDYLFFIDADEIPNKNLVFSLPELIEFNNPVDVIWVPRVNTVEGLSNRHIHVWKWNVNAKGWVNWPDLQSRIIRNVPENRWKNKVHETIEGKLYATFPITEEVGEDFCLYHPKTIEKQEKQNAFYSTL